ncbi:MAG: hypothetical protein ACLQVN_05580 [Bryobacteraceae bacterium]
MLTARAIRLFIVLAISAISVTGFLEGGGASYRDQQGRFSLRVPNGWTAAPLGDSVQVKRGNAFASVMVSGGGQEPARLLSSLAGQVGSQWKSFKQIQQGASTLGGQRAAFGLYGGLNPHGVDSLLKIVAASTGRYSFALVMSSPTGEYMAMKAGFDEIEQGFSTGSAAPAPTSPAVQVSNEPAASRRGASTPSASTNLSSGQYLRFKRVSFMDDPRQIGGEVFKLLIPSNWQMEGSMEWVLRSGGMLIDASPRMRVFNPKGVEEVGMMPNLSFRWQGIRLQDPEVRPPVLDIGAVLRTVVLPKYFPNLRGAQIVSQAELPQLAAAYGKTAPPTPPGSSLQFRAGKVRLEYQQGSTPVDEDVYCVTGILNSRSGALWWVNLIRFSKAEKGKLEDQYKLFQTVLYSARLNLVWFNIFTQLQKVAFQRAMNVQANIAKTIELLKKNGEAISNSTMQAWKNQMAAQDRMNASFDQYIRGVENYRDSRGETVELPSGYKKAYTNGLGDYVLSDDANFNPNKLPASFVQMTKP